MKTVWQVKAPSKAEKLHGSHPTQKPLALIDRCLRASSCPGDLVLDPFMGSGTTGVAAVSLGRKFIGIEKDSAYRRLSVNRIQAGLQHPLEADNPLACALTAAKIENP